MIAHARTITRRWYSSYEQDPSDPLSTPDHTSADATAVRYHNHLKACSRASHGCGNHRHGGYNDPLTWKEQVAAFSAQEEIAESQYGAAAQCSISVTDR